MTDLSLHFTRLDDGKYQLLSGKLYETRIEGQYARQRRADRNCALHSNGYLLIHEGFIWDLATGAIDTPDCVYASLCHDALCYLIDDGKLDSKFQRAADKEYRRHLKLYGTPWWRRWIHYPLVRAWQIIT